jgi:hypothetical protein
MDCVIYKIINLWHTAESYKQLNLIINNDLAHIDWLSVIRGSKKKITRNMCEII